jgi:probable rRNA maturation factor
MVLNRQRRVPVAIAPLENFLLRLRAMLDFAPEVCVCLVSDPMIARMNLAYRKKPGPTDVLSFPTKGHRARRKTPPGAAALARKSEFRSHDLYLGDIAIAPETARRNTRRVRRSLQVELRILILHGILHLLGYDHETDRGEMKRLERKLRRRLALR